MKTVYNEIMRTIIENNVLYVMFYQTIDLFLFSYGT
jgi:hypothetical protein